MKEFYKEYFNSIFSVSNILTKEEYEKMAEFYNLNYGKFMPKDKNANILDIGCGAGHFLYFLLKNGYRNFLGIDISKSQIEFCKKYITDKVLVSDAFDFLKDKNEIYDLITANDFIEHIKKEKIIEFLKLSYKSLKNGGILIIKTGNIGNIFGLFFRYKDFTHEIGFTEKSLFQVLKIAGFKEIKILGAQKKQKFLNKIFEKFLKLFLKKLYWHFGYVAPEILSPLLIAIAKK